MVDLIFMVYLENQLKIINRSLHAIFKVSFIISRSLILADSSVKEFSKTESAVKNTALGLAITR